MNDIKKEEYFDAIVEEVSRKVFLHPKGSTIEKDNAKREGLLVSGSEGGVDGEQHHEQTKDVLIPTVL